MTRGTPRRTKEFREFRGRILEILYRELKINADNPLNILRSLAEIYTEIQQHVEKNNQNNTRNRRRRTSPRRNPIARTTKNRKTQTRMHRTQCGARNIQRLPREAAQKLHMFFWCFVGE